MSKSLLFLLPLTLFALPDSPSVVSGSMELRIHSSDTMEMVVSDHSIINWNEFSIAPGETVQFAQPSIDSLAINQVLGGQQSQILGSLKANGQVLLINPNGVLFGKEARIDTASFIASTLDLNRKIFEETGDLKFVGNSTNSIVNEGFLHVHAGDLFLIGHQVKNEGTITGSGGRVGMLAVQSATLGNMHIFQGGGSSTVNGIIANPGGNVFVLGDRVELGSTAKIDVSHPTGGGEIFIGGDYRGKTPGILNARETFIANGAQINADALFEGDGGKVIVWADQDTTFHGSISALGKGTGAGGFAEVSGMHRLDFQGKVNLLDENGGAGELLLDPTDITIAAGVASVCGVNNPAVNTIFDNVLLGATLGGCNVTILTSGGATGSGDITISSPVTWAAATTLTLTADRDITLNFTGPIAITGNGSLVLDAARNILVNNGAGVPIIDSAGSGDITLDAGANLTINATIRNTGAIGAAGDVMLIVPTGGTINLNATAPGTFVGSQNGLTSVGDPSLALCARSRPDVTLSSTLAGGFPVYLGFFLNPAAIFPPAHSGATGPIVVACNNLNVLAAGGDANIGHGNGPYGMGFPVDTTATATITVDATGTIQVLSMPGTGAARIGHGGSTTFTVGSATETFAGDICVNAINNILLDTFRGFGTGIGHAGSNGFFTAGQTTPFESGNINVASLTGSIFMRGQGSQTTIGHQSGGGAQLSALGDVVVSAAVDITIDMNPGVPIPGGQANAIIGHSHPSNFVSPIATIGSNVRVSAGNDLLIGLTNGIGFVGIGSTALTTISGIVSVAVGRNLTAVNDACCAAGFGDIYIGHCLNIGGGGTANIGSTTNIAAAGNIALSSVNQGRRIRIQSPGADVNVAAGGNITASGSVVGAISFIATQFGAGRTTRIWAGGNITALTPGGGTPFHFGDGSLLNDAAASIDFRAGGSIQMQNNFTTTSGSVFIAPTTTFAATDLWTATIALRAGCVAPLNFATDPSLLTVCRENVVPAPFAVAPTINCCPCSALLAKIANSSPAILTGCICGAFTNTGNTITTTTGTIRLVNPGSPGAISNCAESCVCACQNIIFGTDVTIATTSGNIFVANFDSITIRQNITSMGNIDIQACNNLTLDSPFTVSTVTGTGDIHLAAGRDLILDGPVSSNSGSICLSALQSASLNNVTSTSGPIIISASDDIALAAGRSITTSNTILVSAGHSLFMGAGSSIASSNSDVTVIVDNQFPTRPLIGTGRLVMGPMTSIQSGPNSHLCIFTALRNLNQIDQSATFNATNFVPSNPPYTDTAQEVWCAYPPISCRSQPQLGCTGFGTCSLGSPFTIFYKDCLPIITAQSMTIIDEFLVDLHPYNEFPGWQVIFWLVDLREDPAPNEPYYVRRRHLNYVNHPKTWTILVDTRWEPLVPLPERKPSELPNFESW